MSDTQGLSNWGRWGTDDQRGSLNLLTADKVRQAAALVKTGKVYSLSMPLETNGPQWPMRHKTWKVTTHRSVGTPAPGSADDVVIMHSHSGTHMDALCHYWYGDHIYNGFAAPEAITSQGITRNAIDNVPALVGRGVLLDVAGWKGVANLQLGEAVTADDLDQCAAAQGTAIQPGDIVLVRTGWMRIFTEDRAQYDHGEPGIDTSTLPWLKAHDIVGIGADNQAVEVLQTIPPAKLPVHECAIRDLGIYLLENFNLDALAADQVHEFLLVIAPLRLTGGAGSPINPIAIA
ncbi:MAG: cyclase family protein [Anaerolineae bacterium]|nr:cyclase family protein [Anaerolineae bacterium]